ncbi:PadR family transcriptional regulator PadR [Aequitasia blattaphilus]|uniref:PadR family transcriptional regulator n=1 Tax=Aequitasia blattaphilus TaxID=2949332 RepID=A0ABT1E7D5_9FIRM|nr:PadR family transcriptional regulator [Aequitasia blattaphilus]MCP1101742.1 PadR family transcriptional regulator [Aequitasia blattaphilus]MCR8614382.1 PadR family transcriptional regulator [Aequitasia blattaphilus]
MSMTSDMLRGHTETIILAHLMEHDSYGYQINKDILEKTNGIYELKEATLYSAFRRLEQMGNITSYWGNEGSGARRRYYAITEEGKEAYKNQISEWEKTKKIIDELIK